jgi:hypothetical protein
MPPTVDNNTVVQVSYDHRIDSQQDLLTLHWAIRNLTGGPVEVDALYDQFDLALSNVVTGLDPALSHCYSTDVTIFSRDIQVIAPIRYSYKSYSAPGAAGGVAADALPPNVSHAITLKNWDVGPANRCVKHMGGVPNTFSANGLLTNVGSTAINNFIATYLTTLTLTSGGRTWDMKPIVYHRLTPTVITELTSGFVADTTRVERRRTVGLGS